MLLCNGVMLRHPSAWLGVRPEEGCSRTAIMPGSMLVQTAWTNRADRGSVCTSMLPGMAVP